MFQIELSYVKCNTYFLFTNNELRPATFTS